MINVQTSKALAAVLICACGVLGCNREEAAPSAQVSPSAPESYMNDPVFMAKVEAQDKLQRQVLKRVSELRSRYEAAKAKAADPKVLEGIQAEITAQEQQFMEIRRKTAEIVGKRLRGQASEKQK